MTRRRWCAAGSEPTPLGGAGPTTDATHPPLVAVTATTDPLAGLDEIQLEYADGEHQIPHGMSSAACDLAERAGLDEREDGPGWTRWTRRASRSWSPDRRRAGLHAAVGTLALLVVLSLTGCTSFPASSRFGASSAWTPRATRGAPASPQLHGVHRAEHRPGLRVPGGALTRQLPHLSRVGLDQPDRDDDVLHRGQLVRRAVRLTSRNTLVQQSLYFTRSPNNAMLRVVSTFTLLHEATAQAIGESLRSCATR